MSRPPTKKPRAKTRAKTRTTPVQVLVPCGITRTTGRYEWVCVAAVHDTEKQRSTRPARGYPARSERHLFVRRWPDRDG